MTPVETVSRWAEGARKALEDYHRALSDGLGGALAASKLAIGLEETFAAELTGPHVTDARLVEVQDAIAALVKAERERATPAPVRAEGEAIKHMVSRFLQWKLPENFNPDGGISFERDYNQNTPWPAKHEPVGTNLFDAQQAEAMVRHILAALKAEDSLHG